MVPVLTAKQSAELDALCEASGIPSEVLMETASRNAVTHCPLFSTHTSILVVCGNGNNGGDGFAMARMLSERHTVMIAARPDPQSMSAATRINYTRACALGIPFIDPDTIATADVEVIVDALVGVGGSGELRQPVAQWTRAMNVHRAAVVSIDVPTGLDATSGDAHPDAVMAQWTMTMEALKPGLLNGNGRVLCGTIRVVAIGASEGMARTLSNVAALEKDDIRLLLPRRKPNSHKFDYGHVCVIAGSKGMRGAAALAAEAALRVGAGLVTLVADEVHPLLPREVMTAALVDAESVAKRSSVIVAGPGYGRNPERLQYLANVLSSVPETPVVLDADGIRAWGMLQRDTSNIVITPHQCEYDWLCTTLGKIDDLQGLPTVGMTARRLGCTIHLKSVPPVTTNGQGTYLCTAGNAGLATAGSGDVLSGIIGGLIAQHVPPYEAAALGAMIHGMAADRVVMRTSQESLIAGDVIRELGAVLG